MVDRNQYSMGGESDDGFNFNARMDDTNSAVKNMGFEFRYCNGFHTRHFFLRILIQEFNYSDISMEYFVFMFEFYFNCGYTFIVLFPNVMLEYDRFSFLRNYAI